MCTASIQIIRFECVKYCQCQDDTVDQCTWIEYFLEVIVSREEIEITGFRGIVKNVFISWLFSCIIESVRTRWWHIRKTYVVFIFFVSWKNEFVVHDRNDVSIECVCSLIKMLVQIWNCYFFDVKLRFYMSKYTIIVSSCFEVSISLNQKFVTKEMYLSPFISNDHHLIYV